MNKKIEYLKQNLPLINRINLNNLNNKQIECINNIYEHYKFIHPSNKSLIRKNFKEERSKMDVEKIRKYSLKLNKKIIGLKEFKNAKSIFCYISFDHEIDTYYLLKYCLNNNKILSVPVIKDNKMIACKIKNMDGLKRNKFNIPEPSEIYEVKKDKIDLVIVPALGFNPLGFRIGYGKGFYDNYLKDYNGYTIGMTFKKFVTTKFIPDKYDVPVNKLIIL